MTKLENIYQSYAQEVFKYLMCLCHNPDLAEELTQETFYQAVRSINNYDGTCKISVWLCQITKHSYYKHLERNKKYQAAKTIPDDAISFDTPETDFFSQSDTISIYRLIHSMEDPYKEILLLRLLGNLSFKEIGAVLGKNENWARVSFYRAKMKLREGIERNEG